MINWPQIPVGVAETEYKSIIGAVDELAPRVRHPDQIYAPVGDRATDSVVQRMIDEMTDTAVAHGYPGQPSGQTRITFDRDAALVLRNQMDISWADAGATRMWTFVSLIALPHLTHWRFGFNNRERWIASDLTRHTWARLWWQAVTFENHFDLYSRLNESELNQLQERRVLGGDPRLVATFALAVLEGGAVVARRQLMREATKRLNRILAFVDPLVLDDSQVREMCDGVVSSSIDHIRRATGR